MTDAHPLVARYLARLDAGLQALPAPDRAEVVGEIRNHIAEATSSGQPVDKVLASLGSAEDLARGYAVELLLNRPPAVSPGMSRVRRFLALTGLIAIGSIPTFVVIVVLGAIGVSFIATLYPARNATRIARCTCCSSMWCRRRTSERGSRDTRSAGNRYCHIHWRPAVGYLRPSAYGK